MVAPLLLSFACERPAVTQAPPATPVAAATPAPKPAPVQREPLVASEPVGASVLAVMDTSADPCSDFYRYACGGWLAQTVRPPDKGTYGRGFVQLADRNKEVLRSILGRAAKDGKGPVDGKLGAMWAACNDEAAHERAGLAPIAPALAQIKTVKDEPSLMRVVGKLHADLFSGFGPLFSIFAFSDLKRPDVYVARAIQGGTGLPDRDFYLKPEHQALLTAYREHVARMLGFLGETPANAAEHAAKIVAFETELATISLPRQDLLDPIKTYNLVGVTGLQALDTAVSWPAYFAALGYPKIGPDLDIMTPSYFRELGPLVRRTDVATLQAYLRWHVLNAARPYLAPAIVEAGFAFDRLMTGAKELSPRWERCVDLANEGIGELVGQAFVKERFAGASKEVALTLIGHIESAFAAGLPALAWMDPVTRERAAEKVKALGNKIGYPDKWIDYGRLKQSRKDHFGNVVGMLRFLFVRGFERIGKPVDRGEWHMPPAVVNAYHWRVANEMVFPAGVLQPPFFSVDFPMAMNFGGIGMVMGHELTHGFDNSGRKYDPRGVLREWWEPGVSRKFDERAQCIETVYGKIEVLPGVVLNGKLTLDENISDFGGIKAAYAGYKDWQTNKREAPLIQGLSNDQLFFLGFAQTWCTLETEEFVRVNVTMETHSPARERVNVPLKHLPGFWEAWQCAPGTPMRAGESACEVW